MFQNFDLTRLYDLNQPWLDFSLSLILFVALAQYSIGRKVGGREGQLLAIVIGMTLSIALSLAQRTSGLSLRSLGPLAVWVMVLAVALVAFHLISSFGHQGRRLKTILNQHEILEATKKELNDDRQILNNLYVDGRLIDQYRNDSDSLARLADRIAGLAEISRKHRAQMSRLREISKKLESGDLKEFRNLANQLKTANPTQKNQLKRKLLLRKNKILSEESLIELEKWAKQIDTALGGRLDEVSTSLKSNHLKEAQKVLEKTEALEKRALANLERMREIEERVLKLSGK